MDPAGFVADLPEEVQPSVADDRRVQLDGEEFVADDPDRALGVDIEEDEGPSSG